MRTIHRLVNGDSAVALKSLPRGSIDLILTSPPYPMIEMWDGLFSTLDPRIGAMMEKIDGALAYEAMHRSLDRVWTSGDRGMKTGGMVCINIGDATRTLGDSFRLYPNHSRVTAKLLGLGYQALPEILWRKRSNKPNKFMGSGMLPPGAYVTQEHEYIMLFRKGDKRKFATAGEMENRRRDAFFWEERNRWFSDVWEDLKGERQSLKERGPRTRSAAYPFELAYRLISMFSVKGDLVVDPFAGTGVTTLAAMASGRNSIGIEMDPEFRSLTESAMSRFLGVANEYNRERLRRHVEFVRANRDMKYRNVAHGFPVMTRQETSLEVPMLTSIEKVDEDTFEVEYSERSVRVE